MTRPIPTWLFVDAAPAFGGHEVMLLSWLNELRAQARITPVLLARADTRLHKQAQQRVTTLTLSAVASSAAQRFSRASSLLRAVRDAWLVFKAIRRYQPQICIVAEGSLLSQAGFTLLLRLLGQHTLVYVPLVESATSMGFGRGAQRDWLMRHVYRHIPHGWITITHEQALQFSWWAFVKTPVYLLSNTVAPEIEQAGVITQAVQQPLRVLVLGRLDAHQKGLDGLLDFLTHTPAQTAWLSGQLHVSLVGEGPYQHEIERRMQINPALHKVLSLQPWAAALDALRQHDVLLLCSRYEGVPLVMLEAMAVGVPVVASDLPGTRAMLAPDCLFAVGDFEQAFRLLLQVSNPVRRGLVVRRNLEMFAVRASAAAFATGVAQLTDQLWQLDVQSSEVAHFSEVSPKADLR